MSYVRKDYPSKRALKQAVSDLVDVKRTREQHGPTESAAANAQRGLERDLSIMATSIVGDDPRNGEAFLEGPHYPKPHKWYAKVRVQDGIVVQVLS